MSVSIVKVLKDCFNLSDLVIFQHSDISVVVVNLEAVAILVVVLVFRRISLDRSLSFFGATCVVEVFLIHFNI